MATSAAPARMSVLRTRLLPPRLPDACLPRPELVERLLSGARGRLVTIVAGAGWGKSTLLTQALVESPMPSVWMSCDERVGGAQAFLAHVAAGMGERFPGVGGRLALEGPVEEQVAELCNEVAATVADDFLFVLDDVHMLERRPAGEALALLVQDLPPNAHLVVAGRSALRLPLGRYRMAGSVQIGEESLAFTEAETAELLRAARLALSAEAATELYRRTEGWPAGLILAAQSGEGAGRAVAAGDTEHGDVHGASFDYLADEVFARLPRETQDFLLDTAVLDRFTAELAERVTGWPDADEIIAGLCAAHMFTIRLEGGWFRYHHLFSDFLRRRLSERKAVRVAELHRRAAAGWLAAGEAAEAIPHFLAAGEHDRAAEVLEPLAEAMVATPAAETLAGWLQAIPSAHRSSRPGLVLADASLAFARGEHESSYVAMERALDVLLDAGEHDRAAVVFFRLLQNMIASGTGSPRRVAAAQRYLPRFDRDADLLPLVRVMVAVVYGYSLQLDQAERELRAAVTLPQAAAAPVVDLYARVVQAWYIDYPRAGPGAALGLLDETIAGLERRDSEDLLGFLSYAHLYRAVLFNDLARHEEALTEAARFQQTADRRGIGRSAGRMAGWLRLVALTGLGRFDEVAGAMVALGDVAPAGESSNFAYRYAVPAARLAAHRGEPDTVARLASTILSEMAAHGPGIDQPLALCDLADTAAGVGLDALAGDLADQARTIAVAHGLVWFEARAALLGAAARGDDDLLAVALDLTARHGFEFLWSNRARQHAGPLLARAVTAGIGAPGQASALAVACGGEVLEVVEAAAGDAPAQSALAEARSRSGRSPRAPIRIATLGGFSVWRGGIPVPELTTGRQKARTLLAILVSADGATHREMLLEHLWPDLPPERGLAALHSALYTLRKALEPEANRQSPPTHVVTDGEAYRLDLADDDEWDAATFLRLADQAAKPDALEARLERLLAAEAAWGGPYLPEWPYEDWATTRRNELDRRREAVLAAAAELLAEAGQARAALARWQQLVDLDPEREAWHRSLMAAYAAAGERALALRQYQACRTLLRERLGVDPSPETTSLYQQLL